MSWMTEANVAKEMDSDAVVARWLDERQQLIVSLMNTARAAHDADAYGRRLEDLCDVLVDYTSAGHFGVYVLLLPNTTDAETAEICRRINQTTEAVLRFNEFAPKLGSRVERREALSHLSLALEERFELEDGMAAARARQSDTVAA